MTREDETLTCSVETFAYGGDGIARVEGRVLFIPETIPGETVRVRITQTKKRYARAEVTDLLSPSPQRIPPCCRLTDPDTGRVCRVPGCVYDHLNYETEVQAKQLQLENFFRRLPAASVSDLHVMPPLAAPAPLHYRNKIVVHVQRSGSGGVCRIGYRMEPSHRVLDMTACPLADAAINAALAALRASPHAFRDGERITLRHTEHDGAVWWRHDKRDRPPPDAVLTETSPAGPLQVPRDGFYQVNPAVGDALVRTVTTWFAERPDCSDVLDLYCGVGVFGLACMAAGGTRLTGVESGRAAVAAAERNARAHGVRPATFRCAELGHAPFALAPLIRSPEHTTAIIDPPRDGLAPGIIDALLDSGVTRLFYVSCDPATLTRDLLRFTENRFQIRRVRLFDMFPRTAHFETLVELERMSGKKCTCI